jgi:hypothetical protein
MAPAPAHTWAPYRRGIGGWHRLCQRCLCLEQVRDTGAWRWQRPDLRPGQRSTMPACREETR